MLKRFAKQEIFADFEKIGIGSGDTLLCKVDTLSVGLVAGDPKTGFLNALLEYLGPAGTIVVPAYTDTYIFPCINKTKKIFKATDIPNTGGFARSVLMHPSSVRSTHPTNSFVALGKYAEQILSGHDYRSHSYMPVRAAMDVDAKGLILGCLSSNPGHLTAHLVQYELGQSTQNILKGFAGACFYDENKLKVFLRKDFGGHSAGARKFHDHYEKNKIITYETIGSANAGVSRLKDSYEVEKKLLLKDPKFMLCNDPLCFSCRASWKYNRGSRPKYILDKIIQKFGKRVQLCV